MDLTHFHTAMAPNPEQILYFSGSKEKLSRKKSRPRIKRRGFQSGFCH